MLRQQLLIIIIIIIIMSQTRHVILQKSFPELKPRFGVN